MKARATNQSSASALGVGRRAVVRRVCLAVLCLVLVLPATARTRVRVQSATADRIVLLCETDGYRLDTREVAGTVCSVVRQPGSPRLKERGFPELPWAQTRVLLADDSIPVLTVLNAEVTEVRCPPPMPSRGFFPRDAALPPLEFGPFYQSQTTWPAQVCAAGEPFNVRELHAVTVSFYPFQYDAGQGVLRVLKRIEVEVTGAAADLLPGQGPAPHGLHRRAGREAVAMFRDSVVNRTHRLAARRSPPATRGAAADAATAGTATDTTRGGGLPAEDSRLLVIVPDGWEGAVAEFATWKRQRGFQVEIARYPGDTGSGTSALGSYIQGRYAAVNTDFVILVGDAPQIPCRTSTSAVPTDTLYTLMDSNDFYHDLFLSRVAVPTAAEATKQLARFVQYERNPAVPRDAAWYQQGVCVASNQDNSTEFGMDKEELAIERTKWLANGFTLVDERFDPGVTAAQITASVNAGRTLLYYLGHGTASSWTTGSFTTTQAAALANGTMLPFVVSAGCNTGEFTSAADCLAEAWMKAGATTDAAGAIGFVGATTAMDWDPPTVMEHALSDLLFGGQVRTLGGLAFGGVQKAMDYCTGSSQHGGQTAATKIMEQTHLFGDATLQLRFHQPALLTVTRDTEAVPQSPFQLQVNRADGARAAVADATVCLYRADGVQGVATTDANGRAAITVDGTPGSDLTLTVFHRDFVTVQEAVPLAAGALRIVSAGTLADALVGEPYVAELRAAGGKAPYTWEVMTPATFPGAWLTLTPGSGQLTGTPAIPGTYSFTMRVVDSERASAERQFTLISGEPVALVSSALPAGTVDETYDAALQVSGSFPPFVFEHISGSLPTGTSLSTGGALRGVPAAAGIFSFGVRATDAKARMAERVFMVEVNAAATIAIATPAVLPEADRGLAYRQALSAHGGTGTGFSWSLTAGAFPEGLAIDRGGVISGIPAAAGVFGFRAAVEDSADPPHHSERDFTLTVNSPVYFTSASLPPAGTGLLYDVPVPVAGSYPPFTYVAKGTLEYDRADSPQPAFAVVGTSQGWQADETEWPLELGFNFPYFGQSYSSVKVGDNGYLILGANTGPTPKKWDATSNNFAGLIMIAPFWNDLVMGSQFPDTGIRVAKSENEVTVCWRGREFDHNEWILEFSAALSRDGRIQFRYGQVQTTNRFVVGISAGSNGKVLVGNRDTKDYGADWTLWSQHATIMLTPLQPLPAWLILTRAGRLTGTPTVAGTHLFTVQVADSRGNTAVQDFALDVTATDSFPLTLAAGWNCVSLPLTPLDPDPKAVFSGASPAVWGWNAVKQQYELVTQIAGKAGYWVLNPGADPIALTVYGSAVADSLVSLESPWNLVGPLGTVNLEGNASVSLPVWEWRNGQYQSVSVMTPGFGYFIRAGTRGNLDVRGNR